jgi:hypothetical protein
VLIVVGVLGIGGCLVCLGIGALGSSKPKPADASVYVFCEGTPSSGYTCTVTHTAGAARANACWDIKLTCHNGALVTGHACQTVAPQGKTTRFVRSSDLLGVGRCNGVASTAVENVTVSVAP